MRTALLNHKQGEWPSIDRVIKLLGPLSAKTGDLLYARTEREAHEPSRGKGRRQARSA